MYVYIYIYIYIYIYTYIQESEARFRLLTTDFPVSRNPPEVSPGRILAWDIPAWDTIILS